MPLPALIVPLLSSGLNLLANAFLAKGKEWVEEKTGVTLRPDLPPEDIAKLKQYELENEVELARLRHEDNRLDKEMEAKYLEDRQDARKRDVAFIQAGRKNERGDNLAYLAVGGLLATIGVLFFAPVTDVQERILLVALGALITIVKDVYSFEFGTSRDAAKMTNSMTKWLDEE